MDVVADGFLKATVESHARSMEPTHDVIRSLVSNPASIASAITLIRFQSSVSVGDCTWFCSGAPM